jgi:hypothetical protein
MSAMAMAEVALDPATHCLRGILSRADAPVHAADSDLIRRPRRAERADDGAPGKSRGTAERTVRTAPHSPLQSFATMQAARP